MKTIVFTSTLSSEKAKWLAEHSKKNGVTKRSILEKALENYQTELIKKDFQEGFKKASQQKDIRAVSDAGIADYLNHLSRHP